MYIMCIFIYKLYHINSTIDLCIYLSVSTHTIKYIGIYTVFPPILYMHVSIQIGEYVCISAHIQDIMHVSLKRTHTQVSLQPYVEYLYRDIHMKHIIAVCEHTHPHPHIMYVCIFTDMVPHTFPFLHTLHLCIDPYIFIYIVLQSLGIYVEGQTQIKPILYTSVFMCVHF